jgi:hypothetical protein
MGTITGINPTRDDGHLRAWPTASCDTFERMAAQAETAGTVVRAYLAELRSSGVLDAVRPRLSADAAKLVDKPPLPVGWVEIRVAHEPLVALAALRGRDEVRAFGHRVAKGQLGVVFRPLLTGMLKLFGGTPASLFSRMETITAVMLRGVKFSWKESGPTAGTLAIDHPYPVDDAVFAVWEGLLLFAYDLVQTTGTVARARIQEGKRGELDVRW